MTHPVAIKASVGCRRRSIPMTRLFAAPRSLDDTLHSEMKKNKPCCWVIYIRQHRMLKCARLLDLVAEELGKHLPSSTNPSRAIPDLEA